MLRQSVKTNKKINVVDDMMGTGKTSWAIQIMNESPEIQKFIFITPFLDEVDRIKLSVTSRKMIEPTDKNKKRTKTQGFKELLKKGVNIVATHSLFINCDKEIVELIKTQNYILILDEVMTVIQDIKINAIDMKMVFNEGLVEEENGWVKWIGDENYDGRFKDIKQKCFNGNLYKYSDKIFYWCFPINVFNAFSNVFILTYMFDGQVQKAYYDMFNIEYEYKSVKKQNGRYELVDYFIDVNDNYSKKINIYYGKLNEIGNDYYALSSTKLKKISKDKQQSKKIKNNCENFLKNIVKGKAKCNMWTTIKDARNQLQGASYTKGFVECNCRATNEFREKENLVYILNRFINPIEKNFFQKNGVEFDEDKFALSELLQWMFRSAIRDGKPINIYIPSKRMRKLLEEWINEMRYVYEINHIDDLEIDN